MSDKNLLAWAVVDLVIGTPSIKNDETPYGLVMIEAARWKKIENAAKACFAEESRPAPPTEPPKTGFRENET